MIKDFVVVKFGSELVTDELGINQTAVNQYASGLSEVYADTSLVVVTSGAVAAGAARLNRRTNSEYSVSDYSDVTLAQLGSASIMMAWEEAFNEAGVHAGGLLVTHNELDTKEGLSFTEALILAGRMDMASIVNENDALSNKELMELACGGDNDGLALHIAQTIGAEVLVLFTKKGGITDNSGGLIEAVNSANHRDIREVLVERSSRKKDRGKGRGGIVKKFDAAWDGAKAGIHTKIAQPNEDMTGQRVTEFVVG